MEKALSRSGRETSEGQGRKEITFLFIAAVIIGILEYLNLSERNILTKGLLAGLRT
ncbi:hypothetical protein ACFLY8_05325 [Halobacteriota archaeon]